MDEEKRNELLLSNLKAWEGEVLEPKALDSSLKKNTAFVRKLKTSLNKESAGSIIKEINSLSLRKYESELILGIQEGLLKCIKSQDVAAAVEITSLLHQRFPESFTIDLLEWLLRNLENPPSSVKLTENEEKDRISKVKILLPIFIEFQSVGLFDSLHKLQNVPSFVTQRMKNGDSITVAVLKEALGYKMRTGLTLTIATKFIKRFPTLIESDESVSNVLKSFSEAVVNRTKSLHDNLKDLSQRKFKAQIRTGRIMEDLEADYEEHTELFESFKSASDVLAPVFGLKLPELEEADEDLKVDSVIVTKEALWTNDEEKRFYTNFIEIPQDLIDNASTGDKDASKAQEMNDFLVKLETSNTMKEVDDTVLEFWTLKLNNKASKNRLLKHMELSKDVGKCRVYARFLKANDPYLNDIRDEIIQYLDQGFRSQIHHNGLNFRNIVFFSEMIKFELIPEHVVFHKIRTLILSLTTPNNIEILTIFFEISGRYLLHEHNKLMEEMLALLDSKRKNSKLTINNKMAISNLFLVLKPPSVKSLQSNQTVLKPEQIFLKTLIRSELNLTNYDAIRKLILKADFKDPDVLKTVCSLFTKPEKINYENIVPLSHILKNMGANFKIYVVDTILENIIRSMEINDYRYNRIRVAQCKYIAEIHERKIISLNVIHDLMYKIMTFGHPNNNPTWTQISELDPPDDYFRIQMITVLLNSLTITSGKRQKKIDTVLKFFDYYIYLKDHPIPKDFEFKIAFTFERYKFERAPNLKDAVERLKEIVKAKGNQQNQQGEDEEEDEDDEDEDDDEDDEDDQDEENNNDTNSTKENEDGTINDETDISDEIKFDQLKIESDNVAQVTKLSYEAYERKLMEEEEANIEKQFEKEFNRLVFESMHAQKGNKQNIDFPQNIETQKTKDLVASGVLNDPANKDGTIPFTLITKSKTKGILAKNLSLPKDVKFASNVVQEEIRRKEEKDKINKYILQTKYEDNEVI